MSEWVSVCVRACACFGHEAKADSRRWSVRRDGARRSLLSIICLCVYKRIAKKRDKKKTRRVERHFIWASRAAATTTVHPPTWLLRRKEKKNADSAGGPAALMRLTVDDQWRASEDQLSKPTLPPLTFGFWDVSTFQVVLATAPVPAFVCPSFCFHRPPSCRYTTDWTGVDGRGG